MAARKGRIGNEKFFGSWRSISVSHINFGKSSPRVCQGCYIDDNFGRCSFWLQMWQESIFTKIFVRIYIFDEANINYWVKPFKVLAKLQLKRLIKSVQTLLSPTNFRQRSVNSRVYCLYSQRNARTESKLVLVSVGWSIDVTTTRDTWVDDATSITIGWRIV